MQIPIIKLKQRIVHLKPFHLLPRVSLPHRYPHSQEVAHRYPGDQSKSALQRQVHQQCSYSRTRLWPFEIFSKLLRGTPKFTVGPLIWKVITWKQSPAELPSVLIYVWAAVINNFTIQHPGRSGWQRFQIFFWMMNYLFQRKEKKHTQNGWRNPERPGGLSSHLFP